MDVDSPAINHRRQVNNTSTSINNTNTTNTNATHVTTSKKSKRVDGDKSTPNEGGKKNKPFVSTMRRKQQSRRGKKNSNNNTNNKPPPSTNNTKTTARSPRPPTLPSPTAASTSSPRERASPRQISFSTSTKTNSNNTNNNDDEENAPPPDLTTTNKSTNNATTQQKSGYQCQLPKSEFIEKFRPDTFRGKAVSDEEVYDQSDIIQYDKRLYKAIQSSFDSRQASNNDIDTSVGEGMLPSDRRQLSRLHAEDMMQQYSEDESNPIPFRVFIATDNTDPRWDNKMAFYNSQRRKNSDLGLGIEKVTIMGKEYYELYAYLVPSDTHKSIKDGTTTTKDIISLYNQGSGFDLVFAGVQTKRNKINTLKFAWRDMVDYAEDLMIFGRKHKTARDFLRLFRDRDSLTYQHHILRQFALETRGDVTAANALTAAYYMKRSFIANDDLSKQDTNAIDSICNKMTFTGRKKTKFFKKVDNIFRRALENTLSEFQIYTLALIPLEQLEELMKEAIKLFPEIWKGLCKMRNINPNYSRGKELILSKQLQVFFQLLSSARQADPKRLVYWSFVQAMASYGWGVANKAQKFSCYWGNTCHADTRDEKMKELTKNLIANQMKLLSGLDAVIIVYDNFQRGQELKYQREGSSSNFVKGTHQMTNQVRYWTMTQYDKKHVEMTYVEQAIPSPSGLPEFEKVNTKSAKEVSQQFEHASMMEVETEPDFTGKRVKSYHELGEVADTVHQVWRSFITENVDRTLSASTFDNAKIDKMHKLVTSDGIKTFVDGAKTFHDKATKSWNDEVDEVTKQLLLGLCALPEESAKQCGAITLDQLFRVGILIENKDGTWRLADNWKERRVYLFGDCKTIENNAKFYRDLAAMPLTFDEASKQADIFMDAMSRVMQLPGDWHAGLAMLQAIYTLFYRGFLEPFKEALEWKRIYDTVSGCYFQACRLADIVADELYRVFLYEFCSKFESYDTSNMMSESESESREEYMCRFAMEFNKFLDDLKSSEDEWRRGCALYLSMYSDFRSFVNAYRGGDSLSILEGYANFAPTWHVIGQNKYVERSLHQLDTLLRDNEYARYMEAMKNRCVRNYPKDTGKRMVAQDEALELKNKTLAQFPFKKKVESFVLQGNFAGMAERCKRTIENYYTIKEGIGEGEVYQHSIAPSMKPEQELIFKILMTAGTAEIKPTRKFTNDYVHDVKNKVKSKTNLTRSGQKSVKSNDHRQGNDMCDRLYSSIQQILPPATREHQEDDDDDEIDEDEVMGAIRSENSDLEPPTEEEVRERSSVDKKGYRKLHKHMLEDTKEKGLEQFKSMDIASVRKAQRNRMQRTRKVNNEILSVIKKIQDETVYETSGVEQDDMPIQPWRQHVANIRRDSDLTDVLK